MWSWAAALVLATRARLFLNMSFYEIGTPLLPLEPVPAFTSVEPPVEGLARSIMNLGMGMGIVLLSKLTDGGALLARTFEDEVTTCFYY